METPIFIDYKTDELIRRQAVAYDFYNLTQCLQPFNAASSADRDRLWIRGQNLVASKHPG
jgi:hypothetical protein